MMKAIPEKLQKLIDEKRILIVAGHYGSGKTEFAVNLAPACARTGRKTALADLDIVNPYFRSREKKDLLTQAGVRLISSSIASPNADLPALPGEVMAAFDEPELFTIFDVGGDPAGAHVLGRYAERIRKEPYALLIVVNARRPQTSSAEAVEAYVHAIERSCGLTASGLIDNTHLCGLTTMEDLRAGAALCEEAAARLGYGAVCHTAVRSLAEEAGQEIGDVFPIDLVMRKPWEV